MKKRISRTEMLNMMGFVLLMVLMVLTGCQKNEGGKTELTTEIAQATDRVKTRSAFDVNLYAMNKTVCDPFIEQTAISYENGIKGSLYYRTSSMPRYYKASDYVEKTQKSAQSIFLTDLNVPTRMFTNGFSTQSTGVVKDDAGNILIEYFGMKFETIIRLSSDQPEGDYEFASLSDDGFVMKALIDGVWQTIINNDGDHPTRMGCASQSIHLTRDKEVPVEITYYQGPRYHIANVLMWRKANDASSLGKDPQCGKSGNNYFFDPNKNSVELQPYKDLLARGWEVVPAKNYFITKEASYNPCVAGTDPIISNLRVDEILSNDAYISWTTDLPATAQLLITDVETGTESITVSDNVLQTVHTLYVTGLKANTAYKARAISVSGDLGRAISGEFTFNTLP
ncbi:MAG: hypothetical protein BroJett040_04250 [Oligoflexia bacterium]|nr:MAG: hypothetical protein BroJett040_04250 [Oligoflexia bacterium]